MTNFKPRKHDTFTNHNSIVMTHDVCQHHKMNYILTNV